MKNEIRAACDAVFDEMIASIQKLCRIDSRRTEARPGAPYGSGCRECLLQAMNLAETLGFHTEVWQDQVGIAAIDGRREYIGIAGHLDVVDLNGTWTYDPFQATIADGKIYARGILDNKGPMLACLYAVYTLKTMHYSFPTNVRLLFGTNEETGMEDMKGYFRTHRPPLFGWTPDCKYPVVYAERGRAVFVFETKKEKASSFYAFINDEILNKPVLEESFHIAYSSPEFGKNQIRSVQLLEKEDKLQVQLIISYPADVTVEQMERQLHRHETKDIHVRLDANLAPVYFDKENPFIKVLERSYEDIMQEDGGAVTTTGGTYAKVIPHIVPYGPSFKGQKGIGHMPDEWMNIADLKKNLYIYTWSLYNLLEATR